MICYVELLLWEVVSTVKLICIEQTRSWQNVIKLGTEYSSTISPELQHLNVEKAVGLPDCGARSCNMIRYVELLLWEVVSTIELRGIEQTRSWQDITWLDTEHSNTISPELRHSNAGRDVSIQGSCILICYIKLFLWELVSLTRLRCIEQTSSRQNIIKLGTELSQTISPEEAPASQWWPASGLLALAGSTLLQRHNKYKYKWLFKSGNNPHHEPIKMDRKIMSPWCWKGQLSRGTFHQWSGLL
jgi:hypothetical protein